MGSNSFSRGAFTGGHLAQASHSPAMMSHADGVDSRSGRCGFSGSTPAALHGVDLSGNSATPGTPSDKLRLEHQSEASQMHGIRYTNAGGQCSTDAEVGPLCGHGQLIESSSVQDTVGVLCIDHEGGVSAGVSSGGIWMKHPGRLGPVCE